MDNIQKHYKNKNNDYNLENNPFCKIRNISESDINLIKNLKNFVNQNCDKEHPLACATNHGDGSYIYGISSNCPLGNDVHAESTLVANAFIYDKNKNNFLSLICMTKNNNISEEQDDNVIKYKIKAPCGICRELLRYHFPNIYIIVPKNSDIILLEESELQENLVKIKAKYLLPFPYVSTKLPVESKIKKNTVFKVTKEI